MRVSEDDLIGVLEDELGSDAYHVNVIVEWVSLRILDALSKRGESTAGEIAREVNMDMREVMEQLELLRDNHVIERREEGERKYWWISWEHLSITVSTKDEGLSITTQAIHKGNTESQEVSEDAE